MNKSIIAGIGHYVPERVVTNNDLAAIMETSDEWIQERTGIVERRFGQKHTETTTTMGAKAAEVALQRAGVRKEDVDFIIFANHDPNIRSLIGSALTGFK
jgi:3-oxoacyl-[acyl-carrier-protein] synthase-3